MDVHANAKLGLAGRRELVLAIESGLSLQRAAARFSVSPATAHRWWHRWIDGGRDQGALVDRSSRPRRQPRRLSAAEEEPILRARRETNLGPGRLAGIVRRARSTIWKVLCRHGLSRRPRGQRQSFRRYEWSRPGALLHLDVKKLARFSVPGHRVTGDRTKTQVHRRVGYDHLHCVVDDRSRVAYVELHPREDADTTVNTLERALRFFADLGCDPPEAVMTDNAMVYRHGRRFRELLAANQINHIRIPPYTPRWNGKVERFILTLETEWAYSRTWPSSHQRARSLQSFIRYYNRRRPHSSLADRPPISRVHNVRGQDT
ncbi:MAG TPA: IS481 family transposase [Gaiellaceae bacterium]|nr:IS481 family transposase [Gaiellaceae bacterium]